MTLCLVSVVWLTAMLEVVIMARAVVRMMAILPAAPAVPVAILLVLRWGTDGAVTLVFALVPSFLIFFRLATLPPPLIYLLE